nr:uncharacterized protein LOC110378241 [Helicoverpa armigera]
MGPVAFRAHSQVSKTPTKVPHDNSLWVDDQAQPLPRSVRNFLHRWIRAEQLAMDRWNAEVIIFEENDGGKMGIGDMQLSHAQVLFRSSFCRKVLSACFILERVEGLMVEHQWEYFTFFYPPEGWRPKYHIYSPGTKPGGGPQHKPGLSKSGCYLVRLFYLGTWRCVWVSDQVPVDTSGSPLLPFSPLLTHAPTKPGSKQAPQTVTAGVVFLWPLLLTKALLKLAAPDMNSDEDSHCAEDEDLDDFNIMHALTGGMNIRYHVPDIEDLWVRIITEVPLFSWDDDDETQPSTIKSKSTKKPTAKELAAVVKRTCLTYAIIRDTKDYPPYHLPGITPGHEMSLLIMMARDLPLKKPLPEPEVALWKYYRWVDWARGHGLYAEYDCPRTRFLKVNGLLKLSYAPHLLDVQSTESITLGFIEEQVKSVTGPPKDDDEYHKKKEKKTKEQLKYALNAAQQAALAIKEELREWIQFSSLHQLVNFIHVIYYPSLFNFTSAGSHPPMRSLKAANKTTDIVAPKSAPLYFQVDGPETNKIRMSLSMLHPRILANSGTPVMNFIEPANFVLERFEWFKDIDLPIPKAYVRTRGYESVEIDFEPGRHFFRVWTHSRMNWHIMVLSDSTVLLNTRDVIQGAAVKECPWAAKFLLNLGAAFSNWIKVNRASQSVISADREFFRSYQPDLKWDKEVAGYDRHLLHWMFRQALQSLLSKTLNQTEWKAVSNVLRKYFCDPDFGFPPKPKPPRSVREIANLDVCDCLMPEIEEIEFMEEQMEEMEQSNEEAKPLVTPEMMAKLLKAPELPITSQVCELATEEVPCGILKDEREKMIRKHEAAIILQAHWRGTWARKCLKSNITISSEVTKYVNDHAFGTVDALSRLMNEFFGMFPGAKYAYSVSSALSGVYGLHHHSGTTNVTPKCKWVPYFQGVFYCHAPVKVHFDVQSTIPHSTVAVFNNDSGEQLPQAYNAHITFEFAPNFLGYTVLGHSNLTQPPGIHYDAHWQLTVMTSIDGAFHICDNEDPCKETPIPNSNKLHLDEMFLPNRRNILGGIQISVVKHEAVSFRAAATSPDLEMIAILRSINPGGTTEEISRCSGRGEIYWPYIRLEPPPSKKGTSSHHQASMSARDITLSARSLVKTQGKHHKAGPTTKYRSTLKMKPLNQEPKLYSIEVVCPMGWPLTLAQWRRVDEVRNSQEAAKLEIQIQKKAIKEKEKPGKPGSAKDKDKEKTIPSSVYVHQPMPGDASVELECALALGGGAVAKRDDDRDLEYSDARKAWDAKEPGRNHRGAQIRKDFRTEFLEVPPAAPSESVQSAMDYEAMFEDIEEGKESVHQPPPQGPSPVSESGLLEMSVESEEEALYLLMPDQLRDRFTPLHFLPYCTKEKNEEEIIIVSPDMAEAAKKDRHARMEAAKERMRELQLFNEEHVLGRQKYRCQVLEKLFVDGTLCPELVEVMEQREEAICQEVLNRNLSATRKKLEAKLDKKK